MTKASIFKKKVEQNAKINGERWSAILDKLGRVSAIVPAIP
jgi:hypothetical protein